MESADTNKPLANGNSVVQSESIEDFDEWIEEDSIAIGIETPYGRSDVHIFHLRKDSEKNQKWHREMSLTDLGAKQLQGVLNEAYPTESGDG